MHRILYHWDSDGHAAAGVVLKYLREEKGVSAFDISLHSISYGMALPEELDTKVDNVIMVDFSLQPLDVMSKFADELRDRLTWIDHHSTSVDMENENPELRKVAGLRHVNGPDLKTPISGCELTWDYFFPRSEMPSILKLVGEWDTWRWKRLDAEDQLVVKDLQFYLRAVESDPKTEAGRRFWAEALRDEGIMFRSEYTPKGRMLREYADKQQALDMEANSFEADFQGLRAVMNNGGGGSERFKGFFDTNKHDVMIAFKFVKGTHITVSMYGENPKAHLGELAKKLGNAGDIPSGGGHAGAAGFQCGVDYFFSLFSVNPSR